jgi:predicted acyltransferase
MSSALPEVAVSQPQVRTASSRLYSLDVFRGATIAAMILVNNPGTDFAYEPLKHSVWNGWTPTDLIFPFFLFIVGVSLVLSFRSRVECGGSKRTLMIHALRRSVIIFLIGLFLNGFPYFNLSTWRVAGVLQRIAIAYLAAAIITLYSGTRGIVLWIAGLLIGYWIAMRFIPVPGIGMPGSEMPLLDPNANLDWYIDKLYLPGAMYEKVRDPEGILSTFPAIATALLGVLTGVWLKAGDKTASSRADGLPSLLADTTRKVTVMLASGAALIVAGQIWNIWFPINKKLWTSSFVLFTAGCALVVLAVCYWITDVKQHRGWWTRPFVVFGTNAIAAYALAELVSSLLYSIRVHSGRRIQTLQDFVYRTLFGSITPKEFGSLVYAIVFVCLCWLPIYWMYRKRIFLKV